MSRAGIALKIVVLIIFHTGTDTFAPAIRRMFKNEKDCCPYVYNYGQVRS
jgi:hypothetical protein